MNDQEYILRVKDRFDNTRQADIDGLDTFIAYEEVFKWKWIATKLKIFSFIAYVDYIDENTIKRHTEKCLQYACKNKKGLPRGFQNGIVSYCLLVSDNIDSSAISFASKRPKKHLSAFEMPIIVDLSKKELHYYKGKIKWGAIYNSFLNNYILHNFNLE